MRVKKLARFVANELERRLNVASKLPYEQIGEDDRKYQDYLIEGHYDDYWDMYSRKETVLSDAIGNRITHGFMKHILQKSPKFVLSDEVGDIGYVMEDVRAAIKTLKLKDPWIDIGVNCVMNGWSHILWEPEMNDMNELGGLGVKVFGYEECHPRYWYRFKHRERVNKISHYRAIYIPRPHGMNSRYHSLQEERYHYRPDDPEFQHLTRGSFNLGYGYARIQPVWDAIVKLRERSDSEHFLKSVFLEVRFPQAWTANKKAKGFVDKVRKASRRRGIAIEAVTNPTTGEDTGLPSAVYRAWAAGPEGQAFDKNQGSAYLDGEWLRLLVNLGYSQIWANGSNAGAMEGSEINLTMDDRADIAEFAYLSGIFKKMLKRLAELGIMSAVGVSAESVKLLMEEKYEMIPWLTWEFNDKSAAAMAREDEMMDKETERGKGDDRNEHDKKDNVKSTTEEIDIWIDNGYKNQFISKLQQGDIKIDDIEVISIQKGAKRYSITFRAFGKYKIPSGVHWSLKNVFRDNESFRHNERVHELIIYCLRNNVNSPGMIPVQSTWLKSVGVKDQFFWYKIKGDSGYHGAQMSTHDDAADAYLGAVEGSTTKWGDTGSTGAWVWDNVLKRGTQSHSAFQQPHARYTKSPFAEAETSGQEFGLEMTGERGFMSPEERKKSLLEPGHGLEGTAGTGEALKAKSPQLYNPSTSASTWDTAPAESAIYTPGYKADPASITGSKKVGPGAKRKPGKSKTRKPIVPYNYSGNSAQGMSFRKFNEFRKENSLPTIGSGKYQRWRKNTFRYNSMAVGAVMNFDIDLHYPGGIVERACKKEWKKIENHKGDLWIYEDQGHGGVRIKGGEYEFKDGITHFDFYDDIILENVPEDSNIARRINEGKAPEISTEYYCGTQEHEGISYQVDFHDALGRPRFDGIAIVDFGNCGADACPIEVVA